MKNIFLVLSMLLLALMADAAPVRRLYQDVKLPTQQMIEKQTFTDPAAADTTGVLSNHAGATSTAAVTVTTGLTNPGVPRNLVITPGATTADVASCVITVTGTNIFNTSFSETFTFSNNQSTAVTGQYAFKTVTSVAFPESCEDGSYTSTWSIGQGEMLGMKRCMADAGDIVFSKVAGAYESTRPTSTAHATSVHRNVVDFNGTMNGSNDFDLFFFQNYRCFP